jgi:hypothetical protein
VIASDKNGSTRSKKVSFVVVPENTNPLPNRGDDIVEYRPISVTINGTPVVFDQYPVITGGRTMVPMRAIFEALETEVKWEVGKEMVTATKDDTTIVVKVGSNLATVNGREIPLEVPALMLNNRTLVPVRFISESLGAEVDWIIKTQTVSINQRFSD